MSRGMEEETIRERVVRLAALAEMKASDPRKDGPNWIVLGTVAAEVLLGNIPNGMEPVMYDGMRVTVDERALPLMVAVGRLEQ